MCDPVVYLVPASQAAETAFKHRANRVLRQLARKFDDLSHLGLSHRQSVARLDRAFFSGRRNIAFGSCRAVEFRLCHAAVDSYHLLLRVDPESSQLILQDVSGSGTWIRRSKHHDWTKIHQCSYVPTSTISVRFGEEPHTLSFDIIIPGALSRIKTDSWISDPRTAPRPEVPQARSSNPNPKAADMATSTCGFGDTIPRRLSIFAHARSVAVG